MKILFKILLFGFLIPILLASILPITLPIYLVIIFIALIVKIKSKLYNYFIKEPFELADALTGLMEGAQKEIEHQKKIEEKLNKKLDEMVKKDNINKGELKPLIAQLFQSLSEEIDLDKEVDKYIEGYFKTVAEKERDLRKKEDNQYLAKSYVQRHNLSSYKKKLSIVDDLFKLTPVEFEKWVKTNIFEKNGWKVSETRITGDGGIDLVLWKNKEKSIAQCKRFRGTVGEPLLRDFYGAMISEGVSKGYFVTTGLFSLSALKFAENKPIELIDRRILTKFIGKQ